ncbi:MAG: hypothetical protein ACXWUH_06725, partial [Burkholderiales bacterium]
SAQAQQLTGVSHSEGCDSRELFKVTRSDTHALVYAHASGHHTNVDLLGVRLVNFFAPFFFRGDIVCFPLQQRNVPPGIVAI